MYRSLLYIAEVLYPDEFNATPEHEQALRRIIITDMTGGDEFHIRNAIDQFNSINNSFPFSAYGIDDSKLGDIKNYTAHMGKLYVDEIGRRVATWQNEMTIPLFTFYNDADDYQRARTRLNELGGNITLTRLRVPITINRIQQSLHPELQNLSFETSFPVDMTMDIAKGELAGKFKDYLKENNIWDISHVAKIKYYDFSFSDYLGDQTVQQMIINLDRLKVDGTTDLIETVTMPDPPTVVSTSPANADTNVSVDIFTTHIVITFSNAMNENQVPTQIDFVPRVDIEDYLWDPFSKILTFFLFSPLTAGTTYTVDIPQTILDGDGIPLQADYQFSFTTAP